MNQELQDYYESSFDMCASKGWKYLLEDFEKIKASISDITKVEDAQTLHFRQGQIDILNLVLTRREAFSRAYKDLEDDEKTL